MIKKTETDLSLVGISITHCPNLDRADVAMICDQVYDDCRILEVFLNDGRGFRIDSRTSNIDIGEVLSWLRGGK